MKNNGWVKLYRKLKENPIYKNSKALHCWIECLLRANHQKDKFYLGRKQIELNSGEFIFGRDEFGRSINISGSTAWFWLQRFEVDRMIDIKKTSKGCLCSIINWKYYQEVDSKVVTKKTANEQQMNTDKNDKNEKNDNNILQTDVCEEWNSDNYINNLLLSKQRHIIIIGRYLTERNTVFPSKKAAQAEIKRWTKDASILAEYTDEQINDSFNYVSSKFPAEWNMSTITKYISNPIIKQ